MVWLPTVRFVTVSVVATPPLTVIGLPGIASFANTATVSISAGHPPAVH